MITIALITILSNGALVERETFTAPETDKGINFALQECKKEERMLAPCMLRQTRDDGATVYTNLESWYQLIVPGKGE